jgi:hypothetical protein
MIRTVSTKYLQSYIFLHIPVVGPLLLLLRSSGGIHMWFQSPDRSDGVYRHCQLFG